MARYAKVRPESAAVHKILGEGVHKIPSEEMRISINLRIDQIETLDRLRREITWKRIGGKETERITKSSIVRAYIDALVGRKVDTKGIDSEQELLNRVLHSLGSE